MSVGFQVHWRPHVGECGGLESSFNPKTWQHCPAALEDTNTSQHLWTGGGAEGDAGPASQAWRRSDNGPVCIRGEAWCAFMTTWCWFTARAAHNWPLLTTNSPAIRTAKWPLPLKLTLTKHGPFCPISLQAAHFTNPPVLLMGAYGGVVYEDWVRWG